MNEARSLGHDDVGSEHILLGLAGEVEGLTAEVLALVGVTEQGVRDRVITVDGTGPAVTGEHVRFTREGKMVLELALREALRLCHPQIAPEHVLLGVVVARIDTVAKGILGDLEADSEMIRAEVLRRLAA